jgi:hypothetical protein
MMKNELTPFFGKTVFFCGIFFELVDSILSVWVFDLSFAFYVTALAAGLPDGLLWYQKSQFWYIFEGLGI